MVQLAAGVVTFLFSDMEGSTRALEEHPDLMASVLRRQHDVLRSVVESHAGNVFETLGDGVFASFALATDAVAAALDAQLRLRAENWGAVGEVRVRMGLHSGEVDLRDGHYFGAALFRCARMMAIGYGGQVLISSPTCDLLGDSRPAGVTLRSLGIHRLKDLNEPTEVFQLLHPELPAEFPALKSLNASPNNLPAQSTRFVGREADLSHLEELVLAERFVSVYGPGGAGKTRLALQAAADLLENFADGVWLVELAPLSDPGLVAQAVAATLGVREEPGRPIVSSILDRLRERALLLVLDNCEHVLDACAPLVDTIVRSCPRVHVLATTRAILGVGGEYTWRLQSMSLPPPPPPRPPRVTQYEAVRLFVDRAQASSSSFTITSENADAVADICRRLDGIPLAIELAAARLRMMSLDHIRTHLDDRFRLLTGGSRTALPRQQTLRALIDWSYELLSDRERTLLQRLSVFAGGWTLELCESICADQQLDAMDVVDVLGQLVDKSLVLVDQDRDEPRYRMLESIRHYAREKLIASGDADVVRGKHLEHFVKLAERSSPEDFSPGVMEQIGGEYDNVRAALAWAIETDDVERGLRLAGGLWGFWFVRGYYVEGRSWLDQLLALRSVGSASTGARVRALQTASHLANCQGQLDDAVSLIEQSRALSDAAGDPTGVAAALHLRGNVERVRGNLESARRLYLEAQALNRSSGNQAAQMLNQLQLAEIAFQLSEDAEAESLASEIVINSKRHGHRWAMARALFIQAEVALVQQNPVLARQFFDESLTIQRELADQQGQARSLAGLARVALFEGDRSRAADNYLASLRVAHNANDMLEIARSLEGLAELSGDSHTERAIRLLSFASTLRGSIGAERYPRERARVADLLQTASDSESMSLEDALAYALEGSGETVGA